MQLIYTGLTKQYLPNGFLLETNFDSKFHEAHNHKMVKHTQQFVGNSPTNCLSVFDHFVGLALKGIIISQSIADSTFSLDFIVKFENDICEAGDNTISIILLY